MATNLRKTGLRKDLKQAKRLANKFLPSDPFSKVDASRSPEITNLLNQYSSLSDPSSTAFAGRRTSDMSDYLARMKDASQGYDSNEMRALREARRGEMERGFQSGRATLARGQNQARLGATQRTAQLAELARSYGQQSAQAENELIGQFATEKQNRLNQYGQALTGAEQSEKTRANEALANYQNALTSARADEYDRTKFNAGQEAADRAQYSSGLLGILGIQEARRNAAEQNRLIEEGYRSNERIAGRSSSSPSKSYADALNDLIKQYGGQSA